MTKVGKSLFSNRSKIYVTCRHVGVNVIDRWFYYFMKNLIPFDKDPRPLAANREKL